MLRTFQAGFQGKVGRSSTGAKLTTPEPAVRLLSMSLANIDWTNAVTVPLVTTLLVGFPLAVYGGFVAARIVVFFQEIQRAREAIIFIVDLFGEMVREPSAKNVELKCILLLLPIGSSLRAQLCQQAAAKHLGLISAKIQARLLEEWAVCRASVSKPTLSEVVHFSTGKIGEVMSWSLDELDAIRPNYWRLFNLGGKAATSAATQS